MAGWVPRGGAQTAREFIERHAVALAEVAQRYDGVIDDIRNDPGLRAYLAVAAARSGR